MRTFMSHYSTTNRLTRTAYTTKTPPEEMSVATHLRPRAFHAVRRIGVYLNSTQSHRCLVTLSKSMESSYNIIWINMIRGINEYYRN